MTVGNVEDGMRTLLVVSSLLLGSVAPARAHVSVGIGLPSVQLGIHVPVYPELVVVPGYPVYYAPRAEGNYFFYDGVYWVLHGDHWYASSWYDGPWYVVEPARVPLFVLRVPVRYYRRPPGYFHGWRADAPPRWGERFGRDWERRHAGWDRWDRRHVPRAAPLPVYQRHYVGDRYPRAPEHQHRLRAEHYEYRGREPVTRERFDRHHDRGRGRGRDDGRHGGGRGEHARHDGGRDHDRDGRGQGRR
jgi:hypothetical protein